MKKNLLLLVVSFQSIFSMQRYERMPDLNLGLPALKVACPKWQACSVRKALVVSPSKLTAISLLQDRHISSPKKTQSSSCLSLAASSSPVVFSSSPEGRSSSLELLAAGRVYKPKAISIIIGMKPYDSAASAFQVVVKKQ